MCEKTIKLVPIDTFVVDAETTAKCLTKDNYPCDFVLLTLSNTVGNKTDGRIELDDEGTYLASDEEVYWGFNNKPLNQLFPATNNTFMIPVSEASDVSIRCSVNKTGGKRKVVVNTFRYKEVEKK